MMPEQAVAFDPSETRAHLERAKSALPGPPHYAALLWIHQAMNPASYVEIGVHEGESLRPARPDTLCIGIDPEPKVAETLTARVCLFKMTSDEFFATQHLPGLLGRDHFDLAFVDGLHLFEQVLLDFVHLERFAGPRSIVLLHDCLPLDGATSSRTRTTEFYSGDVWKVALCLRETLPDLQMAVVPAPPTGLCIVGGLDRSAGVLERTYDDCVARYIGLTFDDYVARRAQMPPIIPNKKAAVMSYVSALLK